MWGDISTAGLCVRAIVAVAYNVAVVCVWRGSMTAPNRAVCPNRTWGRYLGVGRLVAVTVVTLTVTVRLCN